MIGDLLGALFLEQHLKNVLSKVSVGLDGRRLLTGKDSVPEHNLLGAGTT